MKKNGFTVVELIVSFALTATVAVILLQIVIGLKNMYINSGLKTQLLNKQALISDKINSSFLDKKVIGVTKCGSYCLNFIYENNTYDRLYVDVTNNIIEFGSYRTDLTEGSYFENMKVTTISSQVYGDSNDALLNINIPIYNKAFKKQNFGLNIVYQYNSITNHIDNIVFDDTNNEYGYIALNGLNKMTILKTNAYNDLGYILYDKNGVVNNNMRLVRVENPFISMSLPYVVGSYDVKYHLLDDAGNIINTVVRKVKVIN
ncbi:MAG: hypothetical protein RSB71_02040 [Bacilli bacterium]